jgi:hypothetical protein
MPEKAGEGMAQRDSAAFPCVEAVCKRTDVQCNHVIIGIPVHQPGLMLEKGLQLIAALN